MQTFDEYRKRAEEAEQAAEGARDAQAKRLLRNSAQRWWQLAEFVSGRIKANTSSENKVDDGEKTRKKDCTK
jgi:hypothetical protein